MKIFFNEKIHIFVSKRKTKFSCKISLNFDDIKDLFIPYTSVSHAESNDVSLDIGYQLKKEIGDLI